MSNYIRECATASTKKIDMYIETAGGRWPYHSNDLTIDNEHICASGVHSPSIGGISQIDAYRQPRLPTLLVGDSKLGGISSTISSYESLILRGYSVDAILLFKEDYHRNWEYLSAYFQERAIEVLPLP